MLKWVKERWCKSSCLLPKVLELQIVQVRLSMSSDTTVSDDCSGDFSAEGSGSQIGVC